MPESFHDGREAREVVTNDTDPLPERGEVGERRVHRDGIAIDPDELSRRGRFQDVARMAGASDGAIDDDSPMLQCREEELDDPIGEYWSVFHESSPASEATTTAPVPA
jgi:hypothetical protein